MGVSKHSWICVDGVWIEVVVSKIGLTFYVSGYFKARHHTGKGRTETEAKSNWKRFAEYEANS